MILMSIVSTKGNIDCDKESREILEKNSKTSELCFMQDGWGKNESSFQ